MKALITAQYGAVDVVGIGGTVSLGALSLTSWWPLGTLGTGR